MKATAPLALQRAAARLLEGADVGAIALQVLPLERAAAFTHGLQRAVLRNTRSDCAPGERARPKSARAFFADAPVRDSDAKEIRQALVLLLDHWRHAQTGETHSVGWYAARIGLEKRQAERYYTVLAELRALHLHQPPNDASGVARGPSGHPYNVTTWVMGLSTKAMRAPRAPIDAPAPEAPRRPVTREGNAITAWALELARAAPS